MSLKFFKKYGLTLVLTLLLLPSGLLAACGDYDSFSSEEMTVQARPSIEAPPKTPTATAKPGTSGEPSLTEKYPEKTVIRSFTDIQGRKVRLVYGRGTGHNGDYGWAHIYGKHINGIWYDGGTISTFPLDAGTKTPQDVLDLIQKSLTVQKPDPQANDRLSYIYPIPGRNKDVFTVVGNDGIVITSYPVNHGSENN